MLLGCGFANLPVELCDDNRDMVMKRINAEAAVTEAALIHLCSIGSVFLNSASYGGLDSDVRQYFPPIWLEELKRSVLRHHSSAHTEQATGSHQSVAVVSTHLPSSGRCQADPSSIVYHDRLTIDLSLHWYCHGSYGYRRYRTAPTPLHRCPSCQVLLSQLEAYPHTYGPQSSPRAEISERACLT